MRDPQPNEGARDTGGRSHWSGLLAILCAGPLLLATACGDGGPGVGPAEGVVAQAATTCTPGGGHATYGTSCESCHACGSRATGGHPASWTDPASAGFHAYSANQGLASCQGCHGVGLDGVGGTARTSCAQCHGAAWRTTCTMCHGGTDNATGAPPKATWGNAAETVRIGAHSSHVGAAHGLAVPIACAACHVPPADALAAGHVGGGTATVTWGGIATSGGAAPAWNRTASTCGSTYCHGATLGAGGTNHDPVWTTVNGTQAACGTCHGIPPPAPHSTSTACGGCHTGYSAATVNAALHVDGKLDVAAMACNSCHGSTANPAPPAGTQGETATSTRAVGAHQAHVAGGTLSNPTACGECHAVPASTSHANGIVEVVWGALARTGGSAPAWNRTSNTCSGTWCHGAKLTGGTRRTPVWTTVDGTQDACGTCHGLPPKSGHHDEGDHRRAGCGACHGGAYTAAVADKSLHLNGRFDITAPNIGWNATQRSCSAPATGCHRGDVERW